ncbi:MAG: thermonuclease family protein [Gammaproteobacteria bacterium]|nr:thermonuclease family protein [Gammaproteobacteria bacterium]MCP5197838.1 thermonuclease family protein [Gammaproteobacteria bacterium]
MKQELLKLLRSLLRGELSRVRRRKNQSPWLMGGLVVTIVAISYFLHEPKAPSSTLPKGAELACAVKTVYDGDTLTAICPAGQVKVRMFGIDAPEMGQKPWGEHAKQVLRSLLAGHDPVRLRVMDQDRYGRTVAQVLVGERDVGLELVRQGQAVMYEQYNDSPVYRQAQAEAKKARRGIWEKSGNQQDPAAWRRLNPR